MMRFLVLALAIALALAAYGLSRTASEKATSTEESSAAAEQPTSYSPKAANDPTNSTREAPPAPLRMRSSPPPTNIVSPIPTTESLIDSYAEDIRDAQATVHEELVRGIVEELAEANVGTARIEALDCKSQHCKLQLASGNSEGLVKLVDALQDERGFLGKAESLMLSRQEDDLVLYLRFPPK